jgi:RNA polymerase sigma-70 factor (ECF subfamily)
VKQPADQELIGLIVQRDQAALGRLYDRYKRLVFSLVYAVVGQQEAAEEITLDVFITIWEKGHTYDPGRAKVRTWLTRLARNRAIDHLRRESVRPNRDSLGWAEVTEKYRPTSGGPGPETAVDQSMTQKRVHEAISTLPENQQEVLKLAYFDGYSHSQIAGRLELPLGTVKGRLRLAMQKLRRQLAHELEEL